MTDEPQVNKGDIVPFHPRSGAIVTIPGDADIITFPATSSTWEVDAR